MLLLSAPSDGPIVINPIKIFAAGSLAAAVCATAAARFSRAASTSSVVQSMIGSEEMEAPPPALLLLERWLSFVTHFIGVVTTERPGSRSSQALVTSLGSPSAEKRRGSRGSVERDEGDDAHAQQVYARQLW